MAQDRRLSTLAAYVVPGWRIEVSPERITADPTLLGALQRNQVLVYRCERPDCGRRVEPELQALVLGGHGHLRPIELQAALRCCHPLGCQLKLFSETYPRGVPLVAYLREENAMVSVTCQGCRHTITRSVADTIDRLRASRRGDAGTGIIELAGRIRGPCRKCGSFAFAATIAEAPRR